MTALEFISAKLDPLAFKDENGLYALDAEALSLTLDLFSKIKIDEFRQETLQFLNTLEKPQPHGQIK